MNGNSNSEHEFVKRLAKIVEANLQNEQFGVSELTREMRMSRSHIHRQLKTLTNLSVSQYIRKIRLERAMEMLRETDDSASEVAFKVGFGSPTYFNHCFHEHFGFTPGEAKKRMNSNDESSAEDEISLNHIKPGSEETQPNRIKFSRKKIIFLSSSVLLVCVFAWFLVQILTNKNARFGIFNRNNKELSIIVLPFKNLSDDLNNQYFADGITEDILDNLFRITALRVVSRTSAEQFRESTLSAREIAHKMKVNYVLEGSVRQYDNKTRISVQLIDAVQDKHLLSTNFDRELTDIIGVQSEIALQVASKMNTVLSENEIRQIEKIPTQNSKAYDYYLQARFLLHKANSDQRSDFDKESVMNCIQYYEKAIAEDENFAEAYAGLANAWLQLSAWGWLKSNEGFLKSREYSLKALEIDPECAHAHAVLGTFLIWGIRNIAEGGKELETSIRLNPNFATARQWHAQYLMITGPIEEARIQVDYALELEPYFWVIQNLNSWIYYFEEKYDKALMACTAAHDFNPDFSSNEWLFVLNYAKLGEGEKMAQKLQEIAKRYSKTEDYTDEIIEAFNKSGINGLFYWLIEVNKNKPIKVEGMSGHPFFIAWWNAILGNKEEAIYWLEKTVHDPRPIYHYFNLITTNPDFDFLRSDPRFLKIVDDIGLTPYHKRKAK
jgi:TolB-like protein/AraC-like DNA-binding protein